MSHLSWQCANMYLNKQKTFFLKSTKTAKEKICRKQKHKSNQKQPPGLIFIPTAGGITHSPTSSRWNTHTVSSVKIKTALYFILFFVLPTWCDFFFISTQKKDTQKQKLKEDKFSKWTNQKEVQSLLHSTRHLSGWQTNALFSHIVCLHQVEFENCNNCLQWTPMSHEGNKSLFRNTHVNTSVYFEDKFQTQDQVTGDNWCNHSQKQNQTTHSGNQVIPL